MFKLSNSRGEIDLIELSKSYSDFYLVLLNNFQKADKEKSPLNRREVLTDYNVIQKSILQNPFEKFERKRFMHHCKDLNYISFDLILWKRLELEDKQKIQNQLFDDLDNYYKKLDMIIPYDYKATIKFVEQEDNDEILSDEPASITSIIEQNLVDSVPENEKYVSLCTPVMGIN